MGNFFFSFIRKNFGGDRISREERLMQLPLSHSASFFLALAM